MKTLATTTQSMGTKDVVPSSPNLRPALATSWNGILLDNHFVSIEFRLQRNHSLPSSHVLDEDFIQRLTKKEDLVPTSVKLLDEDTLSKVRLRLAHISQIEDLRAACKRDHKDFGSS